jgi:hypothetical protein
LRCPLLHISRYKKSALEKPASDKIIYSRIRSAAVTDSCSGASIDIDMKLQIETKNRPQHASRLNRIVFGVALLWLVTSVLLLVLSATGPARPGHEPKNNRTRKDAHQQLYAQVEHQATARTSFRY